MSGARRPGHPDPLSPGDDVVLVDRKERRYLLTLEPGATFSYHAGTVDHDALLGRPEGCTVRSSEGARLVAVRATAEDHTLKAPRGAQVVYPKDQALLVGLADVGPGCEVLEAGAGSGALTAALLRAVAPGGSVVSFERREEHAVVAERSVARRFGEPPSWWSLRIDDVAVVGHEQAGRYDRAVLDLLEPWQVLEPVAHAVRCGGLVACYTPTVPQVMRTREAIDGHDGLGLARTVELLLRPWQVDGLSVRPEHRMVAHTAFLTFARRLAVESG